MAAGQGGSAAADVGSGGGGGITSPAATGATGTATARSHLNGGRFDFDDGGTYCGGWEEGKAHGHGVCTGPKGQGAYSGSWHYGFEVSGVYTWPSGSTFEGQWQNGKRHGLGVETRGRWIYRGEWTQGTKGRYGVRQSNTSTAKYEGTWANGLQDGYGSETYADDGTYQGQWQRGMRHGYGVRTSAPFGKASKYRTNKAVRASLTSLRSNEANGGGGGGGGGGGAAAEAIDKRDRRVDDSRGGFVLKVNSSEPTRRRSIGSGNIKKSLLMGLKLKKQKSTGDLEKRGIASGSIRSTGSTTSWLSNESSQSMMTNASMPSDSNASFVVEDEQMDPEVTETYMGEWKNDKRTGHGVSERSDGLKYEGEWYCNKKYGYGVTTFSNGEKEEGKYKNNVLITSKKKKPLFMMRSATFRERIDAAVNAAQRASKFALQKADIAISRTATARGKAEQADVAAAQARQDSDVAEEVARRYAPEFVPPSLDKVKSRNRYKTEGGGSLYNHKDFAGGSKTVLNQPKTNQPSSGYGSQTESYQSRSTYSSLSNPSYAQNNNATTGLHHYAQESDPDNPHGQEGNPYVQREGISPPQEEVNSPGSRQGYKEANQSVNRTQPRGNPTISLTSPSNAAGSQEPQLESRGRGSLTEEQLKLNSIRRQSRRVSADRPYLGAASQQSSIDHFDHYKRPPSRDSSVDRYARATGGRQSGFNSRQPSVDRVAGGGSLETPDRTTSRAPSAVRGATPAPPTQVKNGAVLTGSAAAKVGNSIAQPPPFEEIILKKQGLGQDIIPSPNQPKRTESLYIPGGGPGPAVKNLVVQPTLQRKKSLPDVQELPRATDPMSREEVSALGSARREEVRRQINEKERLRANPFLYLVSPQVKDWFSRQQLVIIVLFVNISLAIMFFKLLT